jgi:hypothetical protein
MKRCSLILAVPCGRTWAAGRELLRQSSEARSCSR